MKTSLVLFIKVCMFVYILTLTPFFTTLFAYFGVDENGIASSIYTYEIKDALSIKDTLNLMYVHEDVILQDNVYEEITSSYIAKKDVKKVYIYNTHQQEEYMNGKSVIDGAISLANQLQKEGIQVVYESNDFKSWLKNNGYDYNYSYYASHYYLQKAIATHNDFDLIIDFHRDAIPRENSYVKMNNKNYAKMMFVVGGLSFNGDAILSLSNTLKAKIDANLKGVMKNTMVREAYFNHDVSTNMVLIEVGSDHTTFEEVENSTELLAKAIVQYLRGE